MADVYSMVKLGVEFLILKQHINSCNCLFLRSTHYIVSLVSGLLIHWTVGSDSVTVEVRMGCVTSIDGHTEFETNRAMGAAMVWIIY